MEDVREDGTWLAGPRTTYSCLGKKLTLRSKGWVDGTHHNATWTFTR